MLDEFEFIIASISNTSQDLFQKTEAKQVAMYDRIEEELRGVQQALHYNHILLGDEPTQLRRIADATKAHLYRAQEEKEQAKVALKKA
jgi:hypothetical protein